MNLADSKFQVLILTPIDEDAILARQLLADEGVGSEVLKDVKELCHRLSRLAAAIVISEESLTEDVRIILKQFLKEQESWSDIPIILITSGKTGVEDTK